MRLVIVSGALGALAILVLQNLSVVLPLVILGQPVVALPVGVWMGIAIATGVLTNGLRSEEHTSELQSLTNLVCRLLLEKKKYQRRFFSVQNFRSHLRYFHNSSQ